MNLNDLLDIVRNEKLYTKRIEELQDAEEKAKSATAQLTKAKDLDTALANAKRAEQTAASLLKEAQAKHQAIISDAEREAGLAKAKATLEAQSTLSSVADKRSELDSLTQQLEAVTKQLDATQRDIADAKAELSRVNAQSSELREQVTKKQQQLKELLSA